MRKVAFIAAIAMLGGINILNSQQSDNLSDIVLANVEALADMAENDNGGGGNTIYCCGNFGTCMVVYDPEFIPHNVAGLKLSTPCPK